MWTAGVGVGTGTFLKDGDEIMRTGWPGWECQSVAVPGIEVLGL